MKKTTVGSTVTQGPNGKVVTLDKKPKNVQALHEIALQLLTELTTEPDYIDGERVQVVYHKHVLKKLEGMGVGDPPDKLNQLIAHHYLVHRTKAPDPISFYIFASETEGEKFAKKHPQAD